MSDQRNPSSGNVENNDAPSEPETRRPWQQPKLEFVEPKLVKQGEMKQITGQGFVGTFIPD
jgi:hypothetical protein